MNKKSPLSAFLVVILIGGLFLASAMRFGTVQAVSVDSISKPSVPEFTIKMVAHPYYVPPEYSFNPYTGKNTTIQAGHTVENVTVELTIKNQPFTPYISDDKTINLYYNIRYKGHFEEEWKDQSRYEYVEASSGKYTVKSYPASSWDSPGSQVDFQVQSLIGYPTKITDAHTVFGEAYHYVFTGEASSWSDTQTFTVSLPVLLGLCWETLVTIAIVGIGFFVLFVVAVVVVVMYLSKKGNVKAETSKGVST